MSTITRNYTITRKLHPTKFNAVRKNVTKLEIIGHEMKVMGFGYWGAFSEVGMF